MRAWVALAGVCGCGVGCTGERSLPQWEAGIIAEGDCSAEVQSGDSITATVLIDLVDPLINLATFDGIGRVIDDENQLVDLMVEMNFSSYPLIDWDTQRVAVMAYEARQTCEVEIDSWDLVPKSGGGAVFEAQFYDSAMGCAQHCDVSTSAVSMIAFGAEHEVSLCRRVRPGCVEE
ncbi:MAG TPA: hypothetical protein ENK18_04320 [Deltaproteobacteria bacterium]|nr:hypothetical protein [Deltaproteobacteria bacterium]